MVHHRVFETLSAWGLMTVGEQYGLSPVDLWKSNSRVNQGDSVSGKGKEKETDGQKDNQSGCTYFVTFDFTLTAGKYLEAWTIWTKEEDWIDQTLSKRIWRTRLIGILYMNAGEYSIFLVLLAPLTVDRKGIFKFCCRDRTGFKPETPYAWIAAEFPFRDMVEIIKQGFRTKGHKYIRDWFMDILWGWERYVAQVKVDISGVSNSSEFVANFS